MINDFEFHKTHKLYKNLLVKHVHPLKSRLKPSQLSRIPSLGYHRAQQYATACFYIPMLDPTPYHSSKPTSSLILNSPVVARKLSSFPITPPSSLIRERREKKPPSHETKPPAANELNPQSTIFSAKQSSAEDTLNQEELNRLSCKAVRKRGSTAVATHRN